MTQSSQSRLTRRTFIAAAGAAAATANLTARARVANERVDIAIVGAGLAGMNAAMILTELGAKVVVLERGVPHRRPLPDDGPLASAPDLGGAQIGRDYARVLDTRRGSA
jgi:monoamine oxidase